MLLLLADGSLCGGVNKVGVAFYNKLINEVIAKGLAFAPFFFKVF